MNAFKKLFGIGQDNKSSIISPDTMQKLNLFPHKAEKEKSLENKIDKYKKKYHEQRQIFKQEHLICKDNVMKLSVNQEKIDSLNEEIEQKRKENKRLEEIIAENKKKLIEMNAELEKMGKPVDFEGSSLNLAPSLTSLQYDNLKEKLMAKNKRVAELEEDLAKESQKTENMLKEITFLKIEIGKM